MTLRTRMPRSSGRTWPRKKHVAGARHLNAEAAGHGAEQLRHRNVYNVNTHKARVEFRVGDDANTRFVAHPADEMNQRDVLGRKGQLRLDVLAANNDKASRLHALVEINEQRCALL